MKSLVFACALFAALLAACADTVPANPPRSPGNLPPSDETCGIQEVHCQVRSGGQDVRTGYCCTQDFECGGNLTPNCPADSCCFVGHEMGKSVPGAREVVPQKREMTPPQS